MQHVLGAFVDPAHNFVLQRLASKQHYPPSALSPYFWVNGRPPESEAFKQLVENQFADWRLEIGGLLTNPGRESYPDAPNEALDRPYYEVLDIKEAKLPQTLLAYEMNGEPLSLEHGAPVRLRAETLLGFKMVKYLRSIELVADYRTIWEGQGGFREDVQFYSMTAQI
jgi:sulfoxide reductase catalytic subunit YedY